MARLSKDHISILYIIWSVAWQNPQSPRAEGFLYISKRRFTVISTNFLYQDNIANSL